MSCTSALAAAWTEPFEGRELSRDWEVDRSSESKGALRLENSALVITVEENRYHHIERELVGMDGTDAAPLRLSCSISAGHMRGSPTVLALYWGLQNVIAVGPVAGGGRGRQTAQAYWVVTDERGGGDRGGRRGSFVLGGEHTPAYFRIVVTARTVTASASTDGVHWLPVVSLGRGSQRPGELPEGPPKRLILGRGWFGDDPAKAHPDLDNDSRRGGSKCSEYTFDDLRVTSERPRTPLGSPPGYEALDTWDETLRVHSTLRPVRKWMVLGPFQSKNKGAIAEVERGPEKGMEKGIDLKRTFDLLGDKKGSWAPHELDDDQERPGPPGSASETLDFRHCRLAWGGIRESRAVCFAYARIIADVPRTETFSFNGYRWLALFVNGRLLRADDTHRWSSVPGIFKAAAGLSRGVNHVLVKVEGYRDSPRFALRHGPADPSHRIRLLRRLIADFAEEGPAAGIQERPGPPGNETDQERPARNGPALRGPPGIKETDKALAARFEIARLWEEKGCALKAIDVLDEVIQAQDASTPRRPDATLRSSTLRSTSDRATRPAGEQVASAHAERARLFKLLRNERAAAGEMKALAALYSADSPERTDAIVESLSADLRAGRERSVEDRVEELERTEEERPGLLRLVHLTLAGTYEELGKREGRTAHLRRALELADDLAGQAVPGGSPRTDALHVEYAEALLEPVRRDYLAGQAVPGADKPPDRDTLREALTGYRRAIAIACRSAERQGPPSPLTRDLEGAAGAIFDDAMRGKGVERALEVLPALYVRACLAGSKAGREMLAKLPAPRRRPPDVKGSPPPAESLEELLAADMVRGWHVVGPFDNTDWKAYREQIVNPQKVDVRRPVRGKSWLCPPDKFYAPGHLDLMSLLQKNTCVAFLCKEIWAGAPSETELRIGCDDGLTLWFNGKKIHEDREQRGVEPDTIVLPVRFEKGVNRILARVQQGGGEWGFLLRVSRTPEGAFELAQLLYKLQADPGRHSRLADEFLGHARKLAERDYQERPGPPGEAAKAIARALISAFPDRPDVQADAAMHFAGLGLDKDRDLRGAEEFAAWGEELLSRRPLPGATTDRAWRLAGLRDRGAEIALRLGDFGGAAAKLRSIVRADAGSDRAVRALIKLADLYRVTGYLEAAKGHYLDALRRPVGDMGLRAEAHQKLGNIRRVQPCRPMFDVSFDAGGMLRTADRAAARRDLKRAVRGYQRAVDRFARGLFRFSPEKLVGIAEYAADRIRALGPEGIAAYREDFDGQAESLYSKALLEEEKGSRRNRVELLLARVAEEYALSSFADDALNRLGNLYLDSGHADRAAHVFGTLLAEYPDTDLDRALVQAKYAFAAVEAARARQERPGPSGDDAGQERPGPSGVRDRASPWRRRALRAIEALAKRFGSSTFTVVGRKWRGASYATELRAHIGGKPQPVRPGRSWSISTPRKRRRLYGPERPGRSWQAVPGESSSEPVKEPAMTSRYEIRFPVSPVEMFAAPRMADAAYRPVATHGVVAGLGLDRRGVIFHTLDETFAVDLGTGELRWRSGLFFEHLRRGAGCSEFGGVPETRPAVADGRVYVRALRLAGQAVPGRSGRGRESAFVIEARDSGDGRLLWSTGARADLEGLSAVSSPTAADGAVFAVFQEPGENQRLHAAAFDAVTGELLWRQRCVAGFAGISFTDQRNVYLGDHGAAPSVADGNVYVATDMGAVIALAATTGSIRWIAEYPRAVLDQGDSAPVRARLISRAAPRVVVGAHRLYVLPRDSMALLCINRANGDILWRRDLVDCYSPVGLVPPAGDSASSCGRLVIQGSGVAGLDAATGAVEWRWRPGEEDGELHGLAALTGDAVYVATGKGMHRLRPEDGREAGFSSWKDFGVDGPIGNLIVLDDAIIGFDRRRLVTLGTASDTRERTAGRGRRIRIPELGVTAGHDRPIATAGLARAEFVPPVLARWHIGGLSKNTTGGRVLDVDGSGEGELYVLVGETVARVDLEKDRIVWRTPALPDVKGVSLAGDVVMVAYDGFVSVVDRNTGRGLWSFHGRKAAPRGSPQAVVLRAYDARGREELRVLAPRDGRPISRIEIGRSAFAWSPIGNQVFVAFTDRRKLWAKTCDIKTGGELWQHDFEIEPPNDTRWVGSRAGSAYIYSGKRLVRFDVAERREVFRTRLGPRGGLSFRFEGGYLIAVDDRRRGHERTFAVDPETGEVLFEKDHNREQPLRFAPGKAVLSGLSRLGKTVCFRLPAGEEMWTVEAGQQNDRFYDGAFAASSTTDRARDYWVQPYERAGRIRVRLIGAETGEVEGDFDCPGATHGQDPGFVFRPLETGGLLVYGTAEGVFALGGLPPVPKGTDPLKEAVRHVGQVASAGTPLQREGAGEFLANYAREGYSVFLAPKGAAVPPDAGRAAMSIRVDGRADDWAAGGIKAIEIAGPFRLRTEPEGGTWEGPGDLSARARLAWDRRYVYVGVEVTDDTLVAPAPGADLSTGDSVIIGFDPEADSAEGPDDDDMILQMALVGGRSRLVQLHGPDIHRPTVQGDDRGEGRPEIRVSRIAGAASGNGLFYELALPWAALRTAADERPGKKPAMRLGLAVLDWDGARPDGALEWGYGLVRGLRPRLFGDISFVDFSPERVARYHRFIDCLPSHEMSWRFLGRIGEAAAGSGGEEAAGAVYEEFVRKHPGSALAPRALAKLALLYRGIDKGATREDTRARVAALAARAKVPARAIGDALGPGDWSGGLGGAVRQWVYLDPEETPVEIMLEFKTERDGLRRCFWGADMIQWGKPNTEERWPMGDLPPAGRWVQVTVPVGALKLEGHSIRQIGFSVHAGRAYWDLTELVADGDVKVLLDDELARGAGFRGNGAGKWVDGPVKSGGRAHTNGTSGGRSPTRSYATLLQFKVDPTAGETKEPTKAELEKYVEAARILPDTEEAITLLRRAEGMYNDLKEPKRAESVAEMYAAFLRESPDIPRAHEVLTRVRRILLKGQAVPGERASLQDAVARCERIMDEVRLPRAQRRLFYNEYATGIRRWEILGYFPVGGEAGIEKALPPERFPVNLNTVHRAADGVDLRWRETASANGIVDLRAHLGGVPNEVKWPVAYLYTRIESPRRQKVSLTVKVNGSLAAWVGGKQAGPVVSGRFGRGEEFPFPATLKKGVNDVLLKVSERQGAVRVFCRLADLNGRPVSDAPGGLACRLPPRLLGVLAYQRAAETKAFFSRPIDPVSAGDTSNYSVDKGVQVKSARVDADGRTVVLTTSELSADTTYTLSVANVTDTREPPNAVEPGTWMRFSRTARGMEITSGLVAHWRLDETGTETTAADSSTYGNDGNLFGDPEWYAGGRINGALDFDGYDGSQDYVQIPNSPTLENVNEGDYTLSAWVCPDTVGTGTYSILQKPGYNNGLMYHSTEKFGMAHWLTTGQVQASSANTFAPGTFHHVVGVVSRTNGTVELYVDGNLEGSNTFTAGADVREYNTSSWRIGCAYPGTAQHYSMDGKIDDARIYDRALGPSEIQALASRMGLGLKGEYFEGQDFAEVEARHAVPLLTRIDATVNFDWGGGSPGPAVPADGFCVRWTGRVEPLATGRHSFHAVTDDGVRLWVDGRLIIDDWVGRPATESTGHVELEAGRLHPIKMEYYEGHGAAVAKLLWTDPVRGKEVVPTSQLYP